MTYYKPLMMSALVVLAGVLVLWGMCSCFENYAKYHIEHSCELVASNNGSDGWDKYYECEAK